MSNEGWIRSPKPVTSNIELRTPNLLLDGQFRRHAKLLVTGDVADHGVVASGEVYGELPRLASINVVALLVHLFDRDIVRRRPLIRDLERHIAGGHGRLVNGNREVFLRRVD